MSIPQNGKVVIIDDHLDEESFPLLLALSREGISFICYTGRENELPLNPLKGVRLLFLDLKLEGLPGTFDTNDIISSVKPVVEKIIDNENGPYILFGWTDTPGILDEVVSSFKDKPIVHASMDKIECLSSANPIDQIKQKLYEKLNTLGFVGFIFQWENFINKSAYTTTNNIFEMIKDEKSLSDIVYKLSESYLGEHIKTVEPEIQKRAVFQTLNNLLVDTTKGNVFKEDYNSCGELIYTETISKEALYRINTKLLFNLHPSSNYVPGNIYKTTIKEVGDLCDEFFDNRLDKEKIANICRDELEKADKKTWKKKLADEKDKLIYESILKRTRKIREETQNVFIEITPICDYSQKAMKSYRVLAGLLIKQKNWNYMKKSNNSEDAYYSSPFFFFGDDTYKVLTGFRYFVTLTKKSIEDLSPFISLNQELLFDIQHRMGSHFSRPGVLTVI